VRLWHAQFVKERRLSTVLNVKAKGKRMLGRYSAKWPPVVIAKEQEKSSAAVHKLFLNPREPKSDWDKEQGIAPYLIAFTSTF